MTAKQTNGMNAASSMQGQAAPPLPSELPAGQDQRHTEPETELNCEASANPAKE
jgi:hypothetical protein